jgi:hypothetical protein
MKNILFIIISLQLIISCNENKTELPIPSSKINNSNLSLEEMVKQHILAQLSIPSNEKFSYKIYKEHLDGDNKIDAIISVNRLEFALDEAKKSGKYELLKELGFTGHYNYFFYFDGGLNKISPAIVMPSSPESELKVNFENISTAAFKDVLIDYKIRNSSFRNFYIVSNHTPKQVFQWKIYDHLNEKNIEANYLEYATGSYSLTKDILIYEGNLLNAQNVGNIYKFNPIISKKNKLLYRFFYLENEGKYFTKK